ncbi:hypothetical protein Mycsm_00331 [Mycobacterium sp. JS623]|nr:hypothetical protein Mycsm_00331 [Mycobacterium sp. JS623]
MRFITHEMTAGIHLANAIQVSPGAHKAVSTSEVRCEKSPDRVYHVSFNDPHA